MMNQGNDTKSQYRIGDEVLTRGGAHVRLIARVEDTKIWQCEHVAGRKSPFAGSRVSEDNIERIVKRKSQG